MNVLLSHPTGNANVRAVLNGLLQAGLLAEFHTTLASFEGDWWSKIGKSLSIADLQRRQYPRQLREKTFRWPARETGRMLFSKTPLRWLTSHESGPFSTDAVYRSLDKHIARHLSHRSARPVGAVYAYEDGALSTFQQARKMGINCVYDLPIAYWQTMRELMSQERERLPEWKVTLGGEIADSQQKLERKAQEFEAADIIIAPSQFVADTLPESAKTKKVLIACFGSPSNVNHVVQKEHDPRKPLRVLFAGSMGQRKGLGDLFEAVKRLSGRQIELVVMGSLQTDISFYRQKLAGFAYEPPRPHHKVLELMASCDIFCLPSIIEGRALVMQEAMSQGLPLIITPNTGGQDLVLEGQTGFVVPIRSPEKIAEKLTWFLENRQAIPWMSQQARMHASTYSWENYSAKISTFICQNALQDSMQTLPNDYESN